MGEALPFSNRLRVFAITGRQLRELVNFGLNNKIYGWIQTSWLSPEVNERREVVRLFYKGPSGRRVEIKDNTPCTIVADEFMTKGGDGYSPDFFPVSQEISTGSLPPTTDAFINYLKLFKTIGQ